MKTPRQKIIYHSIISKHSTLAMDLEIVRRHGYDGIEVSALKARAFLAAGFTGQELRDRFGDIEVPGVGFLLDIERHGDDRASLIQDAADIFDLAATIGAKAVQVITGPVDVQTVKDYARGGKSGGYQGVLGLAREQQIAITAANLATLADMAEEIGLILYLEALAWAPLNRIDDQLELIERAGRDNIKLVVDYWHCFVSGDTPGTISQLDKSLIYGVHVCDSIPFYGGIPDERILRDLPIGSGAIDLVAWTNAVLSTGYEGWWSAELFCAKQHQENSFEVAGHLKSLLFSLVDEAPTDTSLARPALQGHDLVSGRQSDG